MRKKPSWIFEILFTAKENINSFSTIIIILDCDRDSTNDPDIYIMIVPVKRNPLTTRSMYIARMNLESFPRPTKKIQILVDSRFFLTIKNDSIDRAVTIKE